MRISILTLFPDMFRGPFEYSIIKRALTRKQIDLQIIDIRMYSTDAYKSVDDRPYGGGTGMILRVDVLDRALTAVLGYERKPNTPRDTGTETWVVLLDPQGTPYRQPLAQKLSSIPHLVLICGHYEGFDERIRAFVDQEISIGDYILTGGELPAMAIVDSITRLLPGVLPKPDAPINETFHTDENGNEMLEFPQYTRPSEYKGLHVPEVLLSGNHKHITTWRAEQEKLRTRTRRPDLLMEKTDQP